METQIIRCTSADELFHNLSWRHPRWRGAGYGEVAFRGQGDARWPLIPSAFREGVKFGYLDKVIDDPLSDPQKNAHGEYLAISEFLKLADAVGLHVPGDSQLFRGIDKLIALLQTSFKDGTWPPLEVLDTLAIAQHHGVPTRLLDFTYQPWIAAFFAVRDVILKLKQQGAEVSHTRVFAVWAVDLRFIRGASESYAPARERIRQVTVPRAQNPFLHAQHGLFLLDVEASDHWNEGKCAPLEKVMSERAEYWLNRVDKWRSSTPISELFLPTVRIEAPWHTALDVLRLLRREGITQAHLMPSYDGVVDALKTMRDMEG